MPSSEIEMSVVSNYFFQDDLVKKTRLFDVFSEEICEQIHEIFSESHEIKSNETLFRNFKCKFYQENPVKIPPWTLIYFPPNNIDWTSECYFWCMETGEYIYPESNSLVYLPYELEYRGSKTNLILGKKNIL